MPIRWRRVAFLAVIAVALVGSRRASASTVDDDRFRQDVLFCEEALSILSKCCPDFRAGEVPCGYDISDSGSCDFVSTRHETPSFTLDESTCIRAASCEDLAATGVCARAQAARDYVSWTTNNSKEAPIGNEPTSSHAAVCP
jgi:hypothetical protein